MTFLGNLLTTLPTFYATVLEYPTWVWLTFFAVVLVALFVDIGIVNRHSHVPSRKETVLWAIVWIGLAVGFNGFIYWYVGNHHGWDEAALKAKEYLTGYLIELSLSVDNLFVFLLIFSYFKVPKELRHRVLFWGIMGALVMRMIMIFAGSQLVESFHWIIYVFGAFLIYTGLKMFSNDDESFEPHESALVKFATKTIRIEREYDGEKFFTTKNGVRSGTMLLLVLIVIEFTDLVFAVDSIPAILGITTDRLIVYTSNIFAILGLRTFFFLLADLADRFHLLKIGLAFVLTFVGVKMLLPLAAEGVIWTAGEGSTSPFIAFLQRFVHGDFKNEVINISLAVVVLAIALSVILSMVFPAKEKPGIDNDDAEIDA